MRLGMRIPPHIDGSNDVADISMVPFMLPMKLSGGLFTGAFSLITIFIMAWSMRRAEKGS
jgi:hypothetical protein